MEESPQQSPSDEYIEQLYRPSNDGKILIYAGDLKLRQNNSTWLARGDLELRLGVRSELFARFAGRDPWIINSVGPNVPSVELPSEPSLNPPTSSAVPVPDGDRQWATCEIRINRLRAGIAASVRSVVLHITGQLTDYPLPKDVTDHSFPQGQIYFILPGWDLRLVRTSLEPSDETDFSYVIKAIPHSFPVTEDQIALLIRRVFTLLRFVTSDGVGIGPRVGLDNGGRVVWVEWVASYSEFAGWRWCSDREVLTALPALADGLSNLSDDPGLEACVDRAISFLLAVNEPGLLDVKIPIACSGLELLGWSILQHRQWLTPDDLGKLSAGARTRLFLQWASIPINLPSGFDALTAWRGRQGRPHVAGPELIFEVRNRVVHPPKRLSDPEWLQPDELWEAFRLATWYLELALLRILNYNGEYVSCLQLTGWTWKTEPMPWRR